jgi:bifunctional non-homologous end joining protein LigD
LSRNQLPQNCPPVAAAIAQLAVQDVILDGELTWGNAGVAYHVFDVPWLNGRDLTLLPLVERLAILDALVLMPPLRRVTPLSDPKPWERARRKAGGRNCCWRDSLYEHRRSPHWLKMKCEASQELVVGGFTDPQGGRIGLGALLVGYFDQDEFVFAGKVGTGFDTAAPGIARALRCHRDPAPFTKAVGLPRVRHWARPDIVVQVGFIEWTAHGKLRHSRFLGVRTDKAAREVVREV